MIILKLAYLVISEYKCKVTFVQSRPEKVGTNMKAVIFLGSVVLCIALGIGVAYAVQHVGDLHRKAAVVEACISEGSETQKQAGCPNRPLSNAEVKSYHDEADTTGNLGWIAFLFLVFGIGSTVYENINDD